MMSIINIFRNKIFFAFAVAASFMGVIFVSGEWLTAQGSEVAKGDLIEEDLGWNYISATQVASGVTTTEFHNKWVNYLSSDGWKPIDAGFNATTNGFVMRDAPFEVYLPLMSSGVATFHNNNKWDIFKNEEITDSPMDMTIQALDISDVSGAIESGTLVLPEGVMKNVNYVIYKGAFSGADLIYYVHQGRAPRLEKLIRFNSAPIVLDGDEANYRFKISYSTGKPEFVVEAGDKAKIWLEDSEVLDTDSSSDSGEISSEPILINSNGDGISVYMPGSDIRGVGFGEFQVWDSAADIKKQKIAVDIDPTNIAGEYILTKHIPTSFFEGAVLPVYTDTTSTFYPDPNVEVTSVDGWLEHAAATWALAHDAASALVAYDSDTYLATGSLTVGMYRAFTLFDTSAIPDSATISSATYSLYATAKGNLDNDGDDFVSVVTTSPASNTAIVADDYDQMGTTEQHDSGARIDIGSVTTSAYNSWALNATGLGNISKTGVTKFGPREGHDLLNNAALAENYIQWSSADVTGTTQDPKLVVVYSEGSSSSAPSFNFWGSF